MKELKKIYKLLSPVQRRKTIIIFILTFISSCAELVSIGIIPGFLILINNPQQIRKYRIADEVFNALNIQTNTSIIIFVATLLILIFILKNIFVYFVNYLRTRFAFRLQIHFSNSLFQLYMKAPYLFHVNHNMSELLVNVNDQTKLMVTGIVLPLLTLLSDTIMALSILFMLVYVNPFISLIALLVLGLFSATFLNRLKHKISIHGHEMVHQRNVSLEVLTKALNSLKESKVLNREFYFANEYDRSIRISAKSSSYYYIINQLPKPIIETISVSGILVIMVSYVLNGASLETVIPILVLFTVSALRLMPSITQILSGINAIKYNLPVIDPVYKHLNELKSYQSVDILPYEEITPMLFKEQLQINNLSFKYPQAQKPSLNNVNITIPKGSAIGLVGLSGAGKTTLIDCILGLLEFEEGDILVDQTSIKTNVKAWQNNIGYIPQHIYLSNESILNNIALGLYPHQIDESRIKHAVDAAQLTELIESLPEKLDTKIGDKGVRLSGGQRQRIGIARALYNNPQLLIMDEATSALDNITEKFVIEAIERLKGDRTIIMIAHRLSTVKNCDCLYLMKNGEVIASGTYDELSQNNMEFKKMLV